MEKYMMARQGIIATCPPLARVFSSLGPIQSPASEFRPPIDDYATFLRYANLQGGFTGSQRTVKRRAGPTLLHATPAWPTSTFLSPAIV